MTTLQHWTLRSFKLLILSGVFGWLVSCGNEPPLITFPIYHVLEYQAGSLNIPTDSIFLSVYFIYYDDNGFEDLSTVKLIHLDTDYSWTLTPDMLNNVEWGDKTYNGYSFFEYDNAKSILVGDYKLEVIDKAGNIAESFLQVEIPGADIREPYKMQDIKYQIKSENHGKELKITGGDYNSLDIKVISNPELFNGMRKKFSSDEKIILNKKEALPTGSIISVRINQDVNETRIIFLRNFALNY